MAEDKFILRMSSGDVFEIATKKEITLIMLEHDFFRDEIEFAMHELDKTGHEYAEFGIFKFFVYTASHTLKTKLAA
jgi:hypothetical protein